MSSFESEVPWRNGRTIQAGSLTEAVQIAHGMKASGTHQFFRGQDTDWPVESSLSRLDPSAPPDRYGPVERIERFYGFVASTPALQHLTRSADAVRSVAQHYGIPTTLVDFSRSVEVAAFFAMARRRQARPGVIVCLDWPRISSFARGLVARGRPLIRLVEEDVPDLWRLQAQQGVFLHLPFREIDSVVNVFDRIVFPQMGRDASVEITKADVYPTRKSPLELMLDFYFSNEKIVADEPKLKKAFGPIHEPTDEALEDRIDGTVFKGGALRHLSWSPANLGPWLQPPDIRWTPAPQATPRVVVLDTPTGNVASVREALYTQILDALAEDGVRHHHVVWKLRSFRPQSQGSWAERRLLRLWEGIRGLPVDDVIIARSLSTLAALAPWHCRGKLREGAAALFGDASTVVAERMRGGPFGYGLLSTSTVCRALRADIGSLAPGELEPLKLLYACSVPAVLFDFGFFSTAYIEDVLPTFVLWSQRRDHVFYNPTEVEVLGLY